MGGDKLSEECGLGSSSDHGEQSSINSGGDSTHLRDSTGEMASEEGHENDSSDNESTIDSEEDQNEESQLKSPAGSKGPYAMIWTGQKWVKKYVNE